MTDKNDKKAGLPLGTVRSSMGRPGVASPVGRFGGLGIPLMIAQRIKNAYEADLAVYKAQQVSGAGLLADETLREFQRDYQNREMVMGPHGQPSNYRLIGEFFERARLGQPFRLFPERDYIVSFADFLDFATGPDSPAADLGLGYTLAERIIYNVNTSDVAGDLLLYTGEDAAYGFRSASMVRKGDELTMLLSLVEKPESGIVEELEQRVGRTDTLALGKEAMARSAARRRQAYGEERVVRLENFDLLPTLAVVRFDLKHRTVAGRCLLRDMGDRYAVEIDVHAAVEGVVEEHDPAFQKLVGKLDGYATVWEVAKTLTLLPTYLDTRLTLVVEERRETALSKMPSARRRELEPASEQYRPRYRTIFAIRVVRPDGEPVPGRAFRPPQFQIPVDGFWRSFRDPNQQGRDAAGLVVKGRTWVRAHLRHKDKPAPPEIKTVYIKASLSSARRRIEVYRRRMEKQGDVPFPQPVDIILPALPGSIEDSAEAGQGRHGAFVYVMRCHAHAENLYKVGFTDRDPEVRARELSSVTATPLPFEVLRAWPVTDGLAAEGAAHKALGVVRLSMNREFFQATYVELQRVIEAAIESWLILEA